MVGTAGIAAFLRQQGWHDASRAPLAGDASTRRYERLMQDDRRALLATVPPGESHDSFVKIAGLLHAVGLSAPTVLAADPDQGLLLVEDFGDGTYSALLQAGAPPLPLYELATDALLHLHQHFIAADLPVFDQAVFLRQTMLFCETYLPSVLGPVGETIKDDFRAAWQAPLGRALAVPQSLLLRDFHAGNLFRLPARPGVRACGLIDFQDAGIGPVTYDLVSLLQDARRDVGEAVTAACLSRYCAGFPEASGAAFETSYAVLAAQRHVRVIAVFARLADQGRPEYLEYLPRLWRLLNQALSHPALAGVAAWFGAHVPAAVQTGQQSRQ
ncbi:MAG: phosphotransferase [Rhodospirillaceae bacterium]|mgnify:FL=1|jgi:N-acetylmuramate 1-kinase|nr:phosphotransferase [Rhodospirillaceae bacterium]MBT3494350.1 phosphotransferase [Rhodospirillaceae bacterium]MBT3780386.1 phosphotransferase [Rhodospirillaceae bacterium]MBT3979109.1 phosphotransferase [Rhodospirillaceae bacterium]MBT4167301.1 phosphotransferase [Rhodospirillaceae bacterium]